MMMITTITTENTWLVVYRKTVSTAGICTPVGFLHSELYEIAQSTVHLKKRAPF
jgi:hypothetical protein